VHKNGAQRRPQDENRIVYQSKQSTLNGSSCNKKEQRAINLAPQWTLG